MRGKDLPTQIVRPKSLTDAATDAIRDAIVSGRIEMGDQLAEASLALSLGLSKTPVREALLRLQREGLVTVSPQRGTFVFTLQPGELTQICELRLALESAALHLALERAHKPLSAAWSGIVAEMRDALAAADTERYLALDGAFHEALVTHAGNAYFIDAYQLIRAKVSALRLKLGRDEFHIAKSFREHTELLRVITQGEYDRAFEILRGHIARKEGSYWQHLDTQPPRYLSAPD